MTDRVFKGMRVLVTGSCGTVGSELVKQLLNERSYDPEEVIGLDSNESALYFQDQHYLEDPRARFFVSNIRDKDELTCRMAGIDIVFHVAALKHVILCERSPEQAVHTNIVGVQNVIAAAQANAVKKVLFTSSDKAVNPTNVMGTAKLMGERLMTAANSHKRSEWPVFASTRFGNVLGSNGSVVPIFRKQIAEGGPVTLTDPEMTRFIMSIRDAARQVIDSASMAHGGEVFVTKMPVVRIADLASAMIDALAPRYGHNPLDIKVNVIGSKPGEKLYEELMNDEESRRTLELDRYFVVKPAFSSIYHSIDYSYPGTVADRVSKPYISSIEEPLNVSQIRDYLESSGLLES